MGCHLQQILDAGANVVLTTKGIDDMSLKYLVEANAIGCRRVPKEDLRWAREYCLFAAAWAALLHTHAFSHHATSWQNC